MKPLGLILTFLACTLLFSNRAAAQCSIVSIDGPADVEAGAEIKITARPTSSVSAPTFKWHISAGTITAGDNTSSITIDTAGLGGMSIKVTVEVAGVETTCSTNASTDVRIFGGPECGIAFDEYGDIKFEDEKARLDNFAIALQNKPTLHGHIIAYAGKRTYRGEASERLARAKNYLVKVRGIEPNRIITVDGGYIEEFKMQFHIIPEGASEPVPDSFNQIPLDKVVFSNLVRNSQLNEIEPDNISELFLLSGVY